MPFQQPKGDKPITVQITAEGFLMAKKELTREELAKPIVFELEPSAAIVVRYVKPESGRFSLSAQRWDDEESKWSRARNNTNFRRPTPKEEGTQRFEGMPSGRYRILESQSGLTTDAFDVAYGGPPTEVHMDLSVLTDTEGRVAFPEGATTRRTRVLVNPTPTAAGGGRSVRVKRDGTFKVRAVRGDPLTLTVTHPILVAAKSGGTVKTTGGASGVVLSLEAGAELHFKVAGLVVESNASSRARIEEVLVESGGNGPMPVLPPSVRVPVTYRAFKGGTLDGDPISRGSPMYEEGVLRIGGLEPGPYSFFLERRGYAPRVLRNVTLGLGAKDLGVVDFSKGSAVQVTLVTADGKPVPNVWANARALDGPSYFCHAGNGGKAEFALTGLSAGRFQLRINASGGPFNRNSASLLEKEITVDGSNDLTLTVEVKD